MLWSSAKVESKELTGESEPTQKNYRPVKLPKLGSANPNYYKLYFIHIWSWREDLNPRPADYKSAALPAELRQHWQSC